MLMRAAVVLVTSALIFTTSCHAMTRTIAQRCVLIDVHGNKSKELVPLLDAFAAEHELVPDKSHPISASFERRDGDTVHADLIYTMSMGRFGAELSLFRFDTSRDADLLAAFDDFVAKEIAPKYKVTKCKDVSDYQIPEIYR